MNCAFVTCKARAQNHTYFEMSVNVKFKSITKDVLNAPKSALILKFVSTEFKKKNVAQRSYSDYDGNAQNRTTFQSAPVADFAKNFVKCDVQFRFLDSTDYKKSLTQKWLDTLLVRHVTNISLKQRICEKFWWGKLLQIHKSIVCIR